MIYSVIPLALAVSYVALGLLKMQSRSYQLTTLTWPQVSKQLVTLNESGIAAIAIDHLKVNELRFPRTRDEMYELMGGIDGLDGMRRNADAFLVLSSKILSEGGPKVFQLASLLEKMQSDAEDLKRAVLNFSLSNTIGYRKRREPLYLQQAATAYYLIRTCFFSIYTTTGCALPLHP